MIFNFLKRCWANPLTLPVLGDFLALKKLDDGSLMLLDYIDFQTQDNSIDLGCGYGVLGMTAARECPKGHHLLIDKDFVAIEYAKLNCKK